MRPILVDLNKAGVSVLLFEDGIRVEVPYSTALHEARLLVAPSGAARPAGQCLGVRVEDDAAPASATTPPALVATGNADGAQPYLDEGPAPVRNQSRWDDQGCYLERQP